MSLLLLSLKIRIGPRDWFPKEGERVFPSGRGFFRGSAKNFVLFKLSTGTLKGNLAYESKFYAPSGHEEICFQKGNPVRIRNGPAAVTRGFFKVTWKSEHLPVVKHDILRKTV